MDSMTFKTQGIFAIRGSLDGENIEEFSEKEQFIGLYIESEEFFLPISIISEIVMLLPITFVPQSDKFIEGVINLRGKIIPAVNLRKMMGLERGKVTLNTRIIIIKQADVMLGLLVDGITYVTALLPSEIESQTLLSPGNELITRIAKHKEKVIGILDVTKIISVAANGKELSIPDEESDEGEAH